jgi:hypothetical protein
MSPVQSVTYVSGMDKGGEWRAENGETENYVYSIALQSDT